jgi:hypothetical protein
MLSGDAGAMPITAGQKGRSPVPAVETLQIQTAAEGRAEGRQRQQGNGHRVGADMLQQLPRHQRPQRNPQQHQHRLGDDRRHRKRPACNGGNADRDHRAGNQSAGEICP